ncbi:MAG: tetratricopeptide (TPR) repeat protein [Planctomycetota bacterium]|jgi:tetratricopeptide (TPR) repeat protein
MTRNVSPLRSSTGHLRGLRVLGPRIPFLVSLLVLMGLSTSCATTYGVTTGIEPGKDIIEAMAQVDSDLAAGRSGTALRRCAGVQALRNLPAELRIRSNAQADAAVRDLALDANAEDGRWSATQMEAFSSLDLPQVQKARLAVGAGQAHLRENSRIRAFKFLRDFEAKNPGHPERLGAGDVLAVAGFSMITDNGRYGIFGRYRSRGVGALELLVLRYPFHPRCAEAYVGLANAYEIRGDLDLAIERLEDLLLYHPDDARGPTAQARLPRLRMEQVERDDFDRAEIERAREEFEAWIARYDTQGGDDTQQLANVRAQLSICYLRLANNDLIVSRYHKRIHQSFGTRQHAERALDQARRSLTSLNLAAEEGESEGDKQRAALKVIDEAQTLIAWADRKDGVAMVEASDSGEGS